MDIRNVAIIAHVDHGKTTLVDCLLKQSGTFRDNQQVAERAMDSNDLERERGITILAKATSVVWKGTRVNIVDTPGHADFGGEVERILSMVDGVVLLVDAAEGPLPQTKFVLGKALRLGLKPIVLINKVDRSDARPHQVHDEVFDLFSALEANDEQLDFPTLFASARQGWAATSLEAEHKDMEPLFDLILRHVPAPKVEADPAFRMLVTTLESDTFLGRILTGRILSGIGQAQHDHQGAGPRRQGARADPHHQGAGLPRPGARGARAGRGGRHRRRRRPQDRDRGRHDRRPDDQRADPLAAGRSADARHDLHRSTTRRLPAREGDKVTTRMIRARLMREAEGNVAIRVTRHRERRFLRGRRPRRAAARRADRDHAPRGLRARGRPSARAVPDRPKTGQRLEPIEEVVIDVDDAYTGVVVEQISPAQGRAAGHAPVGRRQDPPGVLRPVARPDRLSRRVPDRYPRHRRDEPHVPRIRPVSAARSPGRRNGALIANAEGTAVAYAMWNLEERGPMFIDPGVAVYQGMMIGEHSRGNDLEVNVLKGKQLTNIRAAGKDEAVRLTPPRKMSLEQAIAYIEEDELVEVTPKSIRLRKRFLNPEDRKRAKKQAAAQAAE